jgi:acetoin utilization deacetylase AcuC-like enzyme
MKVVFDTQFHEVYAGDPAAAMGRMQAAVSCLPADVDLITPEPATIDEIELAHTSSHIADVRREGVYEIAALAAGGAVTAARIGMEAPCFALIRPPGHHASADTAWGFCYFNNMAIALLCLKSENLIHSALVLDIDLHYGDGTVNILGDRDWVYIHNPAKNRRQEYLNDVDAVLSDHNVDMIGVSAGFDHHRQDWGGLLETEDYQEIGRLVRAAARKNRGGCFAVFEGGYNHQVLGLNVAAFISGMAE